MSAPIYKVRLLLPCLLAVTVASGARAQNPLPPAPTPPAPNPTPAPNPAPVPNPAPAPQTPAPGTPAQPPTGRPGAPGQPARPAGPKPYKEVITAEAKSDPGVFTVHRIDDKLLFEIPANQLGKEFLWAAEIEQLPAGLGGYGGASIGDRVVRWTRRNNTVYLRLVNYAIRTESKGAIARAVEAASLEPIAAAFNVEAEGKDKSVVIDVTRLFLSDPPELSARAGLGGGAPDPTRSYLDRAKAFPTNVEVVSALTFSGGGGAPSPFGPPSPRGPVTATIHYSMVRLPDNPMMPRVADSRVGYFTEYFEEYGRPENRQVDREYISRYRLEKKDPTAAISEPVKPIVYYISREVPEEWRPYVKAGVESWQSAFEQAGFKNAIICKDAPTREEDPNWDPEDVRYSVIRWAPSPTENAMGPHVHDPRTGEIISAHIIMWHNILKLGETWYFTQVGNLDPRATKLPLPQPLMGEIVQYVVAHEVGHTLGLRHNHKASSSYTVAQLRDKNFTAQNGNESSIMDYGRFNYVAQPGDNARLIPIIGPYDKFAIEWGYKPIPNVKNPDDEKAELDRIAARQVTNPMLRFGGEDLNSLSDPTVQTEDLGSDPIEATRLGLKNLNRVARMLVPATTKYGENYDRLAEMYSALLFQRRLELGHVVKLVGGVVQTNYHAGRGKDVYAPVPVAKQKQAVSFLVSNAFATPRELLLPDILNRVQASGVQDQVLSGQRSVLLSLLSDTRIKRMLDVQALSPQKAYPVSMLVRDVQTGVWSELNQPAPQVDLYRRNLQRAYLEAMRAKLQAETPTPGDLRPIATQSLRDLRTQIDKALAKTTDPDTRLHLTDSRTTITRILTPPVIVQQPATPTLSFPFGRGGARERQEQTPEGEPQAETPWF